MVFYAWSSLKMMWNIKNTTFLWTFGKNAYFTPEMLFEDSKYTNHHIEYDTLVAPILVFWAKTAVLPPEMLFLDLKHPNKHLEYD